MNNNRCVICGEIIPEGLQVCPKCEKADYTESKFYESGRNFKNEGIKQVILPKG